MTRSVQFERKLSLAELVSAILNHKDAPAELVNQMSDVLGGLSGFNAAKRSPEFVTALLRESSM